ncbi:hypothetical protein ACTFIV_001562 [Dictyostelium citrinum]
MNVKEMDFNDLSNKSNQIINRISSFSSPIGLSSFNIERNLQEIGDTSKQLNDLTSSKTPFSNPLEPNIFQDSKINRKYGLDPKVLAKNLSNINTSSFTDVQSVPTDIDGYLKVQFENIILNTICDIQKKTSKEFQSHYEQTSIHDWNRDKKYLEEILGQKHIKVLPGGSVSANSGSVNQSLFQQSIRGGSGSGSGLSSSIMGQSVRGAFGQQSQFGASSTMSIGGNIGRVGGSGIYSQRQIGRTTMIGSEDRTKLSDKMKKYASIIEEYDIHMADQSKSYGFPLVHRLMDACLSTDINIGGGINTNTATTIVTHVWNLLLTLTAEIDTTSYIQQLKEQQTPQLKEQQQQQPKSKELQKHTKYHTRPAMVQLLKRSISFLETQFSQVIESRLPKHSNVSLPLNIIVAYIKSLNQSPLTDSSDEIYEGCSIWCIIYYLLRSGYTSEAYQFALEKCGSRYIDILSPIFKEKQQTQQQQQQQQQQQKSSLPTNNISINKDQRDRMTREFNTAKTESKDVFKISVFNLLSCNDPNSTKQQVITSIQDYIWWRLNFIKERMIIDPTNDSTVTLLESLQNDIKISIEKNRNNYETLEIFQLLLVSLQFEDAIVSLYQSCPDDSLHLAIALDYYKLLKTSNSCTNNISFDENNNNINSSNNSNSNNNSNNYYSNNNKDNNKDNYNNNKIHHYNKSITNTNIIGYQQNQQQNQQEIYDQTSKSIHLVEMIKQYTKIFSFEENREAFFYYLLIADNDIKIQEISELVVSSPNGFKFAHELSLFSEFINKQQWRTIIEQSALELENKNEYQSAIEFWIMIEEYPRVLEIYNSRISVLLTSISSERDQLYQFGKQLFNDYQGRLKTTSTARTSYLAFEQLLKLCDFFDFYNKEKYHEAIQKIENLEILPIFESEIDSKVQDYRFLSPHITRNFSSVIQAYVDIIVKQYHLLNNFDEFSNRSALFAGRKQTIQDLQSRTQCIALFAGKIDFPMSGNILPRLMNLFISMSN